MAGPIRPLPKGKRINGGRNPSPEEHPKKHVTKARDLGPQQNTRPGSWRLQRHHTQKVARERPKPAIAPSAADCAVVSTAWMEELRNAIVVPEPVAGAKGEATLPPSREFATFKRGVQSRCTQTTIYEAVARAVATHTQATQTWTPELLAASGSKDSRPLTVERHGSKHRHAARTPSAVQQPAPPANLQGQPLPPQNKPQPQNMPKVCAVPALTRSDVDDAAEAMERERERKRVQAEMLQEQIQERHAQKVAEKQRRQQQELQEEQRLERERREIAERFKLEHEAAAKARGAMAAQIGQVVEEAHNNEGVAQAVQRQNSHKPSKQQLRRSQDAAELSLAAQQTPLATASGFASGDLEASRVGHLPSDKKKRRRGRPRQLPSISTWRSTTGQRSWRESAAADIAPRQQQQPPQRRGPSSNEEAETWASLSAIDLDGADDEEERRRSGAFQRENSFLQIVREGDEMEDAVEAVRRSCPKTEQHANSNRDVPRRRSKDRSPRPLRTPDRHADRHPGHHADRADAQKLSLPEVVAQNIAAKAAMINHNVTTDLRRANRPMKDVNEELRQQLGSLIQICEQLLQSRAESSFSVEHNLDHRQPSETPVAAAAAAAAAGRHVAQHQPPRLDCIPRPPTQPRQGCPPPNSLTTPCSRGLAIARSHRSAAAGLPSRPGGRCPGHAPIGIRLSMQAQSAMLRELYPLGPLPAH